VVIVMAIVVIILDIVVIVMAICCISFNIYRTVAVNNILDDLLANPDQYSNFESLSYYEMVFNSTLAIMVFFAWVKVGRVRAAKERAYFSQQFP